MGLLCLLIGEERISTLALLGLVTPCLMGIMRCTDLGGYALVEPSFEYDDEPAKAIEAPPKGSS